MTTTFFDPPPATPAPDAPLRMPPAHPVADWRRKCGEAQAVPTRPNGKSTLAEYGEHAAYGAEF